MLPVGPITNHMKQSTGGETNLFNHYCTTNENTYGSGWEHFEPRIGQHSGAGFVPNNRGQIFYTSHLDEIDNPQMGELIKTNYQTITQKHFVGFTCPSGKEPWQSETLYRPNGFVRDTAAHIPTQIQLQSQFINGLLDRSPNNIPAKHTPLLHQTYPKDPISLENYGHGPYYMSTEYKTRYDGKQCPEIGSGTVGNREMTGFTENNKTEEPLEGRPDACMCNHSVFGSPPCNDRPTGHSTYTCYYRPFAIPNGREPLPNINTKASVSNGFTKNNKVHPDYVQIHPEKVYDKASDMTDFQLQWIKKNDPAEYINAISCDKEPTMMNSAYQGKQIHPLEDLNFRSKIGNRETSGTTSNEDVYVQTRDDLSRFITHNMTKFYDPTKAGNERNGHINGHVESIKEDGYSRDVKLHKLEPQLDSYDNFNRFTPYQSRSIVARESVTLAPTKTLA